MASSNPSNWRTAKHYARSSQSTSGSISPNSRQCAWMACLDGSRATAALVMSLLLPVASLSAAQRSGRYRAWRAHGAGTLNEWRLTRNGRTDFNLTRLLAVIEAVSDQVAAIKGPNEKKKDGAFAPSSFLFAR